ncbi:hypothetical protein A7K50_03275 [Dehalobacter sp. MCB1]|uniref:hypothetical protein n=1 Tax=Dehalobacter sp. MCB1 TaxID=1844756 RepID=UPI000E6BB576|nr:hypothetical protein [Dehalobacter sp. MCB1]RJE47683.1 hypothetical protein A7K50_03275 [Dehalobacter sp. MCB1]
MQDVLIQVFTSNAALSLYVAILALIVGVLIKRYPWIKKYTNIAIDVFAWIEENYKSWGINGSEKMDYFVKDFIADYTKQYGETPSIDVIEKAKALVESLVAKQNEIAGGVVDGNNN